MTPLGKALLVVGTFGFTLALFSRDGEFERFLFTIYVDPAIVRIAGLVSLICIAYGLFTLFKDTPLRYSALSKAVADELQPLEKDRPYDLGVSAILIGILLGGAGSVSLVEDDFVLGIVLMSVAPFLIVYGIIQLYRS